jgi:4'-phosphopantetheinyl transferase EntD
MRSPFPDDVAFALRQPLPADEQALAAELLPEERLLLSAEASPKRVADFARGRACAREALRLAGAWNDGHPPAILRRDRVPLWPSGFVGSLGHTHGAAAAAAAPATRYRGLGVDIELLDRDVTPVTERVLLPEERAALANHPPALALLWFCAKEAVYKALNPFTGVYLGFHDVRVELPQPVTALPTLTLKTEASPIDAAGTLQWELLRDSGTGFPSGLRGSAGWSTDGRWLVAGVWVKA